MCQLTSGLTISWVHFHHLLTEAQGIFSKWLDSPVVWGMAWYYVCGNIQIHYLLNLMGKQLSKLLHQADPHKVH